MSVSEKKRFSIVVPIYQNESNLTDTIPSLLSLKDRLPGYDLELVLVNDGSTDKSYELMQSFARQYPSELVLVNLTRNFGQTPAIREGLRVATGDCVGIISADLQDPFELFLEMIQIWGNGTKLVIAERATRDEGFLHKCWSGLYWKMVNRYAVSGFPKGGFDFCLLDRQICNDINHIGEKNTSIFPLIFWLGYDHQVLPYNRNLREKGRSQWTFAKKLTLTVNTFINFTYLPVKFMSIMGLTISLLSFIYSAYVLTKWLFFGVSVEGWPTIVVLVSMLGGLTLLSLGIVGEYLWRILDESRNRPQTIVDEVIRDNETVKKVIQ